MSEHRDRGLTLVELLVASAVAAIITVSIGAALVLGLRLTNNTFTRLDQSNAELAITRLLSPDVYAAEGSVVVNGTSASACGSISSPKLEFRSRTNASNEFVASNITTVVWYLSSQKVVRATCVNGTSITDSFEVIDGVSSFTPQECSLPCAVITVDFTIAEGPGVPARLFSVTLHRRGLTT